MSLVMRGLVEHAIGAPKPYGWIITKDHLSAVGEKSAVGIMGPSSIAPEIAARLKAGEGKAFRLIDDDGEHYYYGLCLADEEDDNWDLPSMPLADFGGGSGATEIHYKNDAGKWESYF